MKNALKTAAKALLIVIASPIIALFPLALLFCKGTTERFEDKLQQISDNER